MLAYSVAVYQNLNGINGYVHLNESGYEGTRKFSMFRLSASNCMLMELLNVTEDSSLCNSTLMNLLSLRDRLHLK